MNKILLKVNNNTTYIDGFLDDETKKGLRSVLGFVPESSSYMIANLPYDWDGITSTYCSSGRRGCKCFLNKDCGNMSHFPSGLYSNAFAYLKSKNYSIHTIDERPIYEKITNYEMSSEFEPRDYQKRWVNKGLNAGRGIGIASVGAGKTGMAANLIQQVGCVPAIMYVPSSDLMWQAKEEFERFLIKNGKPAKIGAIGDGEFDPQDITIMTQQTAIRSLGQNYKVFDEEDIKEKISKELESKYKIIKDLICSAKVLIQDECQVSASETCRVISDYSYSAKYRWGISGTPFRDKNDDILIQAGYGKVFDNISASELIELGFLVQPHIYMVNCENSYGAIKGHTYAEIYKEGIVNNAYRNNIISNIAKNMYNDGRNILLLIKHVGHGKMLNEMIPNSVFLSGKDNSLKRREHLDLIRTEKSRICIASNIFDCGVNAPALDTLIMASGEKSPVRTIQRVGRIIRNFTGADGRKKTTAIVVDFNDKAKYLSQHSKKRVQIYKTEPKFIIENLKID